MTQRNKSVAQPQTRRERRKAQRSERQAERSRQQAKQPAWRSPIALMTGAAILVGIAIILFAVVSQPPASSGPGNELTPPTSSVPANLADGRTLGSADAPVQVDIWADFQCPYCGQLARSIEPSLINQFVTTGYARLVFHDLAFLGQRSNSSWDESVEAASAARCAADQGLFWQMQGWLFANQNGENEGAFAQARLRSIAQAAGLDMTSYDSCMAAGDKQASVQSDTASSFSAGIQSTPTIKINGTLYGGQLTVPGLTAAIQSAADTTTPAALPSQPSTTPPVSTATP
ncbi:MAG TPA: thioredoxin domain-containing protein [Candidatus Limnocylindrales bacterium]